MAYKWDNKKPTAQMLGRWQPFHDGHYTLFKEIIKKTGQVCIQIRDVQGVDDNPFDFETVKKNILEVIQYKIKDKKIFLNKNTIILNSSGKKRIFITIIDENNITSGIKWLSINQINVLIPAVEF